MEVLKRNLDAMAAVKLNVFHWHLTEDQGFRVESRKLPKLHTLDLTVSSTRRTRCARSLPMLATAAFE